MQSLHKELQSTDIGKVFQGGRWVVSGNIRVLSETLAGDCKEFTLQGVEWNSFCLTGTKLLSTPFGNDLSQKISFPGKHFPNYYLSL